VRFVTVARLFRSCDQFVRALLNDEHPAALSDGANPIGADLSSDADYQRIASTLAEIANSGLARKFGPAEHPPLMRGQYVEHGTLLSSQQLVRRQIIIGHRHSKRVARDVHVRPT
jgi:hypothetical protein